MGLTLELRIRDFMLNNSLNRLIFQYLKRKFKVLIPSKNPVLKLHLKM